MDTNSDDIEAPPLSSAAGIIYVNIMEARNLPLRDTATNKPPTGYCMIQLATVVVGDASPSASSKDLNKFTENFADSRGPRVRCLCKLLACTVADINFTFLLRSFLKNSFSQPQIDESRSSFSFAIMSICFRSLS